MHTIPKIGLILGQQTSTEVQFIMQEIERQGHLAIVIDTRNISRHIHIEYHVTESSLCLIIYGRRMSMSQISGVYWASVTSPIVMPAKSQKPKDENTAAKSTLSNNVIPKDVHPKQISPTQNILDTLVTDPSMDLACLMQLLFAQSQVNWVNSFAAIQFHRLKAKQLSLANSLGANIPHTYIGKCPQSILAFLTQHPDSIVKPVFAGGHTKRLPTSLTSYDEIIKWASHPITLQTFVPGDNIRTYIIGQFMISAKIEEREIEAHDSEKSNVDQKPSLVSDYREAASVKLIPFELPIATQQLAVRIMRAFHLQYTAIDWRLSPEGKFYFLEANPAPLFVEAQAQLGVDIDRAIVDLMFA
ncbi:MAG: glutathione synthase/RimK-type ligase-like ATP-grasp enzyme [Alphaproteobacteria bacterium]|jgi:glutathione synthase/RimK-type ligase-like ATP-grasp enzyme